METTIKHFTAVATLALASVSAQADPLAWGGSFDLYGSGGNKFEGAADVTGFIDIAAGTWSIASLTPFMGQLWTASGGTLYGAGTHTVNINGDGLDAFSGDGDVTFTVGAGQVGGNINVSWNANDGIDVFQLWDVTTAPDGRTRYTSVDGDGDGVPGMTIVDDRFYGVGVVFNMAAPVPEASTTAMLLAGLVLVGGMGVWGQLRG